MIDLPVILGVLLLIAIVVGMGWERCHEKREWNNGYCKKTGLPWILFDTDSQGGKMYKDGEGNYCDISYNVDK